MHAGAELMDEGIAVGVADVGSHDVPFGKHGGDCIDVEWQSDGAGEEVHGAGRDNAERMAGLPGYGSSGGNGTIATGDDQCVSLGLCGSGLQARDNIATGDNAADHLMALGGEGCFKQADIGLEIHGPQGACILVQNSNRPHVTLVASARKPVRLSPRP